MPEAWERFAAWIMRGRLYAGGLGAVAFSLGLHLPFFAPPFFLLAAGIVILAALQIGTRGAFEAGAVSAVGTSILTLNPMIGAVYLLFIWLPSWLSAEVLRRTQSLGHASWPTFFLALGILTLISFDSGMQQQLTAYLEQLSAEMQAEKEQFTKLAPFLAGLIAAQAMVFWIGSLIFGRYLQGIYSGKPIGESFETWQLPDGFLLLFPAALIAALLEQMILAENLMILSSAVFLFQGLAVVHAYALNHWTPLMLMLFYVALILIAPPSIIMVALLGLSDKLFNLRGRIPSNGNDS